MIKTRTFWFRLCGGPALLLWASLVLAEPEGQQQYISDDISVTIRQKPSNDALSLGVVKSGARVTVLDSLGADSFAHIRTADGRDGWITARFLSAQPAAKEQMLQLKQQLEQVHGQTQSLQRELDSAQQQLAKARPALEMAGENDKLRADIARREQQVSELERQFDGERARRDTLATGAGLVGGGIILGLLLPWIGTRKRRYSDF